MDYDFQKGQRGDFMVSLGVILVVIILFILPRRNPDQQYQEDKCRWSRNMKMKAFTGVVIKKFKDANEHCYPTLLMRN